MLDCGNSMNTPRLTKLGSHKSVGFYADYSEESDIDSEENTSIFDNMESGYSKLQTDTEMDAELLLVEKENYQLMNEGKLLTKKQRLYDLRANNIQIKNDLHKQMDCLNATESHSSRASRHQFDMQGQGHSNYHSQGHLQSGDYKSLNLADLRNVQGLRDKARDDIDRNFGHRSRSVSPVISECSVGTRDSDNFGL